MDQKLFQIIYHWAKKNTQVHQIVVFINKISKIFFIAVYIVTIFFILIYKNNYLPFYIFAPAISLLLNLLIRNIIKKPRPHPKNKEKSSYAFPSNHAMSAAVIALCTFYIYPSFGIILICFSFITAFARIMEGYHYPSDVLAGIALGFLISYTGFHFFAPF